MFFTSPKSNSFLKSRDCADGTLSQRRDEQTTYFSCKSYLIFWATNTQEDKNTRSACREYLPINMFNVGEFQSQFVSKHGSKDDFSKKVFIRFVFLLIAVSGVFRVPLLRQGSQRTFIFSRKRELIWGWKFVYAASFFFILEGSHKKAEGRCSISQSWCTLVTSQSSNSFAESSKSCLLYGPENNCDWIFWVDFYVWNSYQLRDQMPNLQYLLRAQPEEVNWISPNLLFAQHRELQTENIVFFPRVF